MEEALGTGLVMTVALVDTIEPIRPPKWRQDKTKGSGSSYPRIVFAALRGHPPKPATRVMFE